MANQYPVKEYTFMVGEIGDWIEGITDAQRNEMKTSLRVDLHKLFDVPDLRWRLDDTELAGFSDREEFDLDEDHHHEVIGKWLANANTKLSGRDGFPERLFIDRTPHRMMKCCHYAGKIWTSCRVFPLLASKGSVVEQWHWDACVPETKEERRIPLCLQVTWICVDMRDEAEVRWFDLINRLRNVDAEAREKVLAELS